MADGIRENLGELFALDNPSWMELRDKLAEGLGMVNAANNGEGTAHPKELAGLIATAILITPILEEGIEVFQAEGYGVGNSLGMSLAGFTYIALSAALMYPEWAMAFLEETHPTISWKGHGDGLAKELVERLAIQVEVAP